MAYTFEGMFSTGDEAVMADLLSRQRGLGRVISRPFRGFGVSFTDEYGDALVEVSDDPADPGSKWLLDWSRRFPQIRNAFVRVHCFGGDCEYGGFAFADGRVLYANPVREDTPDDELGVENLRRLLAPLGVSLGEGGYFQPFERGFFEWPVPPIAPPQPRVTASPWWRRLLGGRGVR